MEGQGFYERRSPESPNYNLLRNPKPNFSSRNTGRPMMQAQIPTFNGILPPFSPSNPYLFIPTPLLHGFFTPDKTNHPKTDSFGERKLNPNGEQKIFFCRNCWCWTTATNNRGYFQGYRGATMAETGDFQGNIGELFSEHCFQFYCLQA